MKGSSKRKNAQRRIARIARRVRLLRRIARRVRVMRGACVKDGSVADGSGKVAMMLETIGSDLACGCDICRESKRLDEVTVYEVWTDKESFITDQAHIACGIASAIDRPVRIRSKILPRVQFEALQESGGAR